MDIVRITLTGYGCAVTRGIIAKREYNKLKDSTTLDNVWIKSLHKKLGKKLKDYIEDFHDYGIKRGDISITVNEENFMDLPISVLSSYSFNDVDLVELESYGYPVTQDVVVTSIQDVEGTIIDVIFVTEEEFDITKLKFIEKEIHNHKEEVIISGLICEIYYDGEPIPFTGDVTDLRMSKVLFDVPEKVLQKNEKNNNRQL